MKPRHGNAAGNTVLAARLADSGLTQAGLADAVNAVVDELTGQPGRASDRWVRMLLDGSVRRPHRTYRHALATVLQVPVDDLGFQAPNGATPARQEDAAVQGASRARLGIADVDRLRAPLDLLVTSADDSGAANLAPHAIRHAAALGDVLKDAVVSQRVERAAYVLMGDFFATAGWFALDEGNHSLAQRHLDAGLRAAGIARDGSLQAYVWSMIEKSARLRGDHGQALAVARTGLASAAARRDPRIRAAFHALTAISLSRKHDGTAQRSLGYALDALDKVGPGSPGRWAFANRSLVAACGASVSLSLGQLRQAERYGKHAVELTSAHVNQTRNHATRRLSLARIYLEMRDLEAACTHAGSVLDLAYQLRSRQLSDRLHAMDALLSRWPTAAAVREWSTQYDHWSRQAGATKP